MISSRPSIELIPRSSNNRESSRTSDGSSSSPSSTTRATRRSRRLAAGLMALRVGVFLHAHRRAGDGAGTPRRGIEDVAVAVELGVGARQGAVGAGADIVDREVVEGLALELMELALA